MSTASMSTASVSSTRLNTATIPAAACGCAAHDSGHGAHMPDVAAAQTLIRQRCTPLPSERLPLAQAEGRVSATALCSRCNLPPFANAAMDGYALAWRDSITPGAECDVIAERAAGDGALIIDSGDDHAAIAIMTGARMPDGADTAAFDTVVPVEDATVLARDAEGRALRLRIDRAPQRGQHVRRAGEDIAAGDEAVPAGVRLGPSELMLLRGAGVATVEVVRRPLVALACTGRELVDTPGAPLAPGQIYNTNRAYLESRLREAGAVLHATTTIADDPAVFLAYVRGWMAEGVDIVISTGAVSMGRYDFVPDTLDMLGAQIVFHKLRMRPGKPLLFAVLPNGALFFGLPGNPVSSAVGLRFFVEIALRHMLGMAPERPWRLPLAEAVSKKPGFHLFQKAELRLDADGVVRVGLLKGQESFKTRPLLRARVWAGLPTQAESLPAGALVDVHPLCHFDDHLFARE